MKQTELDEIRQDCLKEIHPICSGPEERYFYGQRTDAGRNLPPYYLIYFLLADLLGFEVLGRQEKVAWSIVLLHKDRPFILEHRKLGFGLFAEDKDDPLAFQVVALLSKAVDLALPYYKHRAEMALSSSRINLLQKSHYLLERFEYLAQAYESQLAIALAQKDVVVKTPIEGWGSGVSCSFPYYTLKRQAEWMATAAIEAFFSWTEHFFVHLAAIRGIIDSGQGVIDLAAKDWSAKYKTALDLEQPNCKSFYDKLLNVRRQVRNFVAHGAFGKDGEAFHFHSRVGAIPVYLRWENNQSKISMHEDLSYDDESVITLLKEFVIFIRSGPFATAAQYINESQLDTVLTHVVDGTYRTALQSPEAMEQLIERMHYINDMHADMDW